MHFHAEQLGQFEARGLADRLDLGLPPLPSTIGFWLSRPITICWWISRLPSVPLLVAFGAHRAVVGQFLVELAVELARG